MPQNIIPKDNIPKIFEVREVENKIPSYEEFLKNYQADQEVSNSYENELNSYDDIGINKGFGPCNWSNPRCSCRYGEEWTNLKLVCPLCPYGGVVSNWVHSNSGYLVASSRSSVGCGALEISNKARIQCRGCSIARDMKNWKFECSRHSGETANSSLSLSLSLLATINAGRMHGINERLMTELLNYLENNSW